MTLLLPHYLPEPQRSILATPPKAMKLGAWMHEELSRNVPGDTFYDMRFFDPVLIRSGAFPQRLRAMYAGRPDYQARASYLRCLPYINAVGAEKFITYTAGATDRMISFRLFEQLCEFMLLSDDWMLRFFHAWEFYDNPSGLMTYVMRRRYHLIQKERMEL